MNMTNEERTAKINLGRAAAETLSNPIYAVALDAVAAETFRDWKFSEPHETKKRESAYYKMLAMQEIVDTLRGWVEVAKQLETVSNDNQEDNE